MGKEITTQADRINFGSTIKINMLNYESTDVHFSYSSDVQQGETLEAATSRIVEFVEAQLKAKQAELIALRDGTPVEAEEKPAPKATKTAPKGFPGTKKKVEEKVYVEDEEETEEESDEEEEEEEEAPQAAAPPKITPRATKPRVATPKPFAKKSFKSEESVSDAEDEPETTTGGPSIKDRVAELKAKYGKTTSGLSGVNKR